MPTAPVPTPLPGPPESCSEPPRTAWAGSRQRERLVQLQVAFSDGCVFVVRDEERVVAAVTAPDPTVGLVFYDLKTCLRHVAGEELAPKPKPRSGSKKARAAKEKPEEGSTNGSG